MKPTIGMKVYGEVGVVGTIVAMSKQWCIYADKKGEEFAEPWNQMVAVLEPSDSVVTMGTDVEIPETEG